VKSEDETAFAGTWDCAPLSFAFTFYVEGLAAACPLPFLATQPFAPLPLCLRLSFQPRLAA